MSLVSRKPEIATLQTCEDEPIRIPGAIQPHGVLLCIERSTLAFSHVSANVEAEFGIPAAAIVGEPLARFASFCSGSERLESLVRDALASGVPTTLDETGIATRSGRRCSLRILPQEERLLLEILPVHESLDEPIDFGLIHSAASVLRQIDDLDDFCAAAANGFRRISGYDRVMVYRFAPDGSGEVLAEAKREGLPTYLGMRYPATDIPKQARQLYLENHVRIIPDISYAPVDVLFEDDGGKPLDLGQAQLRSVSPIHIEYLQNMGVGATLTISIVVKGELAGLIACHHYSQKYLHHKLLILCEYFAQAFSLQFGNRVEAEYLKRKQKLDTLRTQLAEAARTVPPAIVIETQQAGLLELASSDGVSFCHDGMISSAGQLPERKWIERFRLWAIENLQGESSWVTDNVGADLSFVQGDAQGIAGLLAVNLGDCWENCIIWFRREVEQTVDWAGKPDKLDLANEQGVRLSPRKSFDLWRETIRGRCLPWDSLVASSTINFARYDLALMLEVSDKNRANELLAELAEELQRSNGDLTSFAYAASHDLQEPLRAVAGCLQVLEKRSGAKFSEEDSRFFRMAVDGARRMQRLVSDLLAYSRLNTSKSVEKKVSVAGELQEALLRLDDQINRTQAKIVTEGELPQVNFSPSQLTTVFQNLIGNAIKFRGSEPPLITVSAAKTGESEWTFAVTDNGIGIGAEYLEDIFTIFARLHTHAQYEGSGIGLAVCRKIIDRHGGRIWVESEQGRGSRFLFTLKEAESDGA